MIAAQLCFDFEALVDLEARPSRSRRQAAPSAQSYDSARQEAYWAVQALAAKKEARAYWKVCMVTSLPLFSEIEGSGGRYTQMLPGVIEVIDGDLASVRIYAAPEYGCWMENYPLHRKLAINVQLTELGKYHGNDDLQRLVDEGRLATGCEQLAAEVRARHAAVMSASEREIARVA